MGCMGSKQKTNTSGGWLIELPELPIPGLGNVLKAEIDRNMSLIAPQSHLEDRDDDISELNFGKFAGV